MYLMASFDFYPIIRYNIQAKQIKKDRFLCNMMREFYYMAKD